MTPDLSAIDRELEELGVPAARLEAARARARELARETGGLEGLVSLLGPDRVAGVGRVAPARAVTARGAPPLEVQPTAAAPAHAGSPLPAPPAAAEPQATAAGAPPEPTARPRSERPAVETVVPEGAAARATTFEAEATTGGTGAVEPASGLAELPEDVLSSSELPAVLSVAPSASASDAASAPAAPPRSERPPPSFADPLELESEPGLDVAGAAPLDSLFQSMPEDLAAQRRPPTQPPPAPSRPPPADLDAELAALFAEESEPPPPEPVPELPEAPITFDADAMMAGQSSEPEGFGAEPTVLGRPELMLPGAPAPTGDDASDFELDIEDVVELDDAELVDDQPAAPRAAAAAKSRPPEPPRSRPPEPPKSRPPEPPGKGFLNRLLNRKG